MKYQDVEYADTLERIEEFLDTETEKIKWHKTCYSAFTNVTFISRLKKRFESERKFTKYCKQLPADHH